MYISLWIIRRIRNVSDSRGENRNTQFKFSNFFYSKIGRLWDNVGKYGTAGQATDDSILNALSKLGT